MPIPVQVVETRVPSVCRPARARALKTSGEIRLRGACESRPDGPGATPPVGRFHSETRRNALFRFFESRRAALSSTVHPKRRPRYTNTSQSSTWSRAPPPPPPPPRASPPPRTRATPETKPRGADTSRRRTRRACVAAGRRAAPRFFSYRRRRRHRLAHARFEIGSIVDRQFGRVPATRFLRHTRRGGRRR